MRSEYRRSRMHAWNRSNHDASTPAADGDVTPGAAKSVALDGGASPSASDEASRPELPAATTTRSGEGVGVGVSVGVSVGVGTGGWAGTAPGPVVRNRNAGRRRPPSSASRCQC